MTTFNREKDELLIDLIRSNPTLYDASDKNYKNIVLKNKAWENISETMKIPVSDLKKRWKHFRDHYKKKERAAATTGQEISENTWEYIPLLHFLSQVPSQRNTNTNGEVSEEIEIQINDQQNEYGSVFHYNNLKNERTSPGYDVSLVEDVSLDTTQSTGIFINPLQNIEESIETPAIKRRKRTNKNSMTSILKLREKKRSRVFAKSAETKKSTTHKFFESMADIVSEFPPHLIAEARLKVCQLVNELERKKNNGRARGSTPMSSQDSSDSSTS